MPTPPAVTTGFPVLDAALQILGGVYAILTALLLVVPKASKVASFLARWAGNIRNIQPAVAKAPACPRCAAEDAETKAKALLGIAFMVLATTTLAQGCWFDKVTPVVPVVIDVAESVCQELAKDLQDEPDFVKFVCSLVAAPGAPAQKVTVKVPVAQVSAFRAKHAPAK